MSGVRKYEAEGARLRAGFTAIPNVVLRQEGVSGNAKALYAVMLDLAWRGAEPEVPELAALIGLTEKPCRNVLRELAALGLLTMKRRGLGLTNAYTLHEPDAFQNGRFDRSRDAATTEPEREKRPVPARAQQQAGTTKTVEGAKAPPTAAAKRKETYLAFARVCGISADLVESADGPRYDKDLARMLAVALASIRRKANAESEDQLSILIQLKATLYAKTWPNITLTPTALAKNWNLVSTTPLAQREPDIPCPHCPAAALMKFKSERRLAEHIHIAHPEHEEATAA